MFYKSLEQFKKDNGHEINGTWYPRVTSIVDIKAKPALLYYYGEHESYAHAQAAMDKSAEEGTLVHKVIEAIMVGQDPYVPEQVMPVVNAFREFSQQTTIVPHQIEKQVISKKHGYAGSLDVLAEISGKLGVLDIKTSQSIYRDYGIQTAAYVEALKEDKSIPELTRWILRMDQTRACMSGCGSNMRTKGGYSKVKIPYNKNYYKSKNCAHIWGPVVGDIELKELNNLEHDTKAFLAAKDLWTWEHDEWLSQVS